MKLFKKFLLFAIAGSISLCATAQVKKAPVKTAPKKTVAKKPAVKKTAATTFKKPVLKVIPGIRVRLTTDSGVIVLRLYDSTPLHRDNFAKLVEAGFYDSLLFHRVMRGFMIQGGDPVSKNAAPGMMLGAGGGDMPMIPAEFKPSLYHKKGVLAAARNGNPEKASSACQFYIVQGRPMSAAELAQIELQLGIKYTPAQIKTYTTIGGAPFLDMNYTVFGEVESGLEVVDKIASVPTDQSDRPYGDVRMKMEIIKK